MRSLVVGYGSIGARHARILTELGCDTTVVSARKVDHPRATHDLKAALAIHQPEYVVVANATTHHISTVRELSELGYSGIVLIEKPVFHTHVKLPLLPFKKTLVAYNLRFHPLIQQLRQVIITEAVLSVQCYVGQYLPHWRPNENYIDSYSSCASRGGGALRDLSHEMDYLSYLLGPWRQVCAVGGHFSTLKGDSDDTFGLMLDFERCRLVQLQMNYTDRVGRRQMIINTDRSTIEIDMINGVMKVDHAAKTFAVARDHTYTEMHRAVLGGVSDEVCSLSQGLATVRLIEAAEQSASMHRWIGNQ